MDISTALPSEIWQEIAELACTDGGRTGASLAMSCKFLRVQTYAKRFHSLAFHSLAQIESFLPLIRAPHTLHVDATQIPVVRHLWLSFFDESSSATSQFAWPWDVRVLVALLELLPSVAPTLSTLVLAQGLSQRLPPLALAFQFPQLAELTLFGTPTNGPVGGDLASTTHCPFDLASCPFPMLRRLHILSNTHTNASARWALISSPALGTLTHLRLSRLAIDDCTSSATMCPVAVLAHVLGVSKITDKGDPSPLKDLRHLILHGIEEPSGWCGTNEEIWYERFYKLVSVAEEWAHNAGHDPEVRSGVPFLESSDIRRAVCLNQEWRRDFKWKARMWDDWVARMEDGQGCWVEGKDEEAAREGPRAPEDDEEEDTLFW